jgi:glycine cleavage system H protein
MTTGAIPAELRYAKTHEWVRLDGGRATVGITDHAQSEMTDIVFVDLPAVGATVEAGKSVLSLESVKTVSDVYAPASGKIVEVNTELKAHPELVNQEPYGRGWLFRLELAGGLDPALVDADGYRRLLGAEGPALR